MRRLTPHDAGAVSGPGEPLCVARMRRPRPFLPGSLTMPTMDLDELLSRDPNTLPYRLTHVATGEVLEARFEPTTPQDAEELRGEAWAYSKFRDVWPDCVGEPQTLKLVLPHRGDDRIQGIMRLGRVPRGGYRLRGSLLESAPWNQTGTPGREYVGVGRQLVLRLILECLRQGGHGSILISASPGSESLYTRLGFRQLTPESPMDMVLPAGQAFGLVHEAWTLSDD